MAANGATLGAASGRPVLLALVSTIHENAAHLSALDGATGDGDHGVNMNKGFVRAGDLLAPGDVSLPQALSLLGKTLLMDIGGAMGPLYGSCFLEMAAAAASDPTVDAATFGRMLAAGLAAVLDVGDAKVGDKTLLDALAPAETAYRTAVNAGLPFGEALAAMAEAGRVGAESTRDMIARVGRASRLGERSRGHVDAGATSCALILGALASSMTNELQASPVDPAAGSGKQRAVPVSIAIGSDEAGFKLKSELANYIRELGRDVADYGVFDETPVLYPDVALAVARAVADGRHDRAILICGTGIGMAITANKVPGVRAAVCHDPYSAARSRTSNDCQVMTIGSQVVAIELAKSLVRTWLASEFEGGRSLPKVNRIAEIDGSGSGPQ